MEKKKKTNPLTKRGGSTRGGTRGSTRGGTRGNTRGNARGNARGSRGGSRGTSRGGMRGNMRGGGRGTMRGARGNMRGNMRSRSSSRQNNNQMFNNQRGQWRKFPQNNTRGGFANNRVNGNIKSNLTRSRSNLSLNRMNLNNSPRGNRGGFAGRRGGKFGLTRSRSRTNLAYNNKPTFLAKNMGFLKRTSSMPNLRDPSSVYNRLGYQSPSQIAYRNRVKRAKTVLLQRQNKAMRMQSAFSLSPAVSLKNLSSLHQKQQVPSGRRYSTGGLHSDQIMRAQRRAQYEQKLMRMGAARSNLPATMTFMNTINDAYNSNQRRTAMSLYPTTMQTQSPITVSPRQLPRGRSPFRQNLQNLKAVTKAANRAARRARSRSRSRANSVRRNNSVISLTDAGDLEDRSFSEVMYSLSNNFGVTGRTLNDRFSLF